MINLICEQSLLVSSKYQTDLLIVTTVLICEQQVLSRLDKSHQHMHKDTKYKWKPIKGENHILLLLWCKGKIQLPLTTIFL